MSRINNPSRFLILLALFVLQAQNIAAQEPDKTEFLLSFPLKQELPVKFTVQYHSTESVEFAIKDFPKNPKYVNTSRFFQTRDARGVTKAISFKKLQRFLGNSAKCDYETTMEVRYVEPIDIACGVVTPMPGEKIRYEKINAPTLLDELATGLEKQSWQRVEDHADADIGILVELEITNIVNVLKGGLRLQLTNARKFPKPFHLAGLNITGVNLDPAATDKIIFKSYLIKPFIEYPSEETLASLMNAVGVKTGKQKNFGKKSSHSLKFVNFEKVDR